MVRDPHFQKGFYLLEPKPGKRVVYRELKGLAAAKPIWDLAQWSSRFPLQPGDCLSASPTLVCSNTAKRVVVGTPGSSAADLSLAVNAGSRNNSGRGFSKAVDGDVTTFFDGAEPNNQYVGLDLGASVQASPPEFSPRPGTFSDPSAVSVTSTTPGAVIRIARGGGTPTRTQGELITGSIRLEESEILAAVAFADGLACSSVVVGPYRIGGDQGNTRLTRTFHIGNSLTDTVDGWLKPLAGSGEHSLDFHRFTIPGAPTDWLWTHPGSGFGDSRFAQAFFAFAPFDAMITQPFADHGRSVENEADYSGRFFELCRKDSPKVQLWLYQQWPDRTFDEGWSKGIIALGGKLGEWQSKLKLQPGENLADGGWQGVILKREPAPKTWEEAVSCHKVSPLNSGLTQDQAEAFQRIAWQSVENGPAAGAAQRK